MFSFNRASGVAGSNYRSSDWSISEFPVEGEETTLSRLSSLNYAGFSALLVRTGTRKNRQTFTRWAVVFIVELTTWPVVSCEAWVCAGAIGAQGGVRGQGEVWRTSSRRHDCTSYIFIQVESNQYWDRRSPFRYCRLTTDFQPAKVLRVFCELWGDTVIINKNSMGLRVALGTVIMIR